VGHGREELAQAAAQQMSELAYFSATSAPPTSPRIQLASKLMSIAYPNMQAVFFTSGGAESNESAFKTARFLLEGQGRAGQGQDHRAPTGLSRRDAAGDERDRHVGLLEDVRAARAQLRPHPHVLPVSPGGRPAPAKTAGQTAARLLEEAILREGANTVAAFIAEPIHGGGGVLYPTDDYFPARPPGLRPPQCALHRRRGDHGFCRTADGSRSEHWNVLPDIVSFAKGVSSGYLRWEASWSPSDQAGHGRGQGRGPLDACLHLLRPPDVLRVGLKNLEIHGRERLWERAAAMAPGSMTVCGQRWRITSTWAISVAARGSSPPWELVEDRGTKAPFGADKRSGRACCKK